MYTTSTRANFANPALSPHGLSFGGDYVTSWRTGKRARADSIVEAPPQKGGSIFDTLKVRKEFLERTMENAGSRYSKPPSDRCMVTDTGHDFMSVKYSAVPFQLVERGTSWKNTYGGFMAPAIVPTWVPMDRARYRAATGFAGSSLDPGSTYPTGAINRLFNQTLPKTLGLGETIVELVRGDLPSVATSLRRSAKMVGKTAARTRLRKKDDPELFRSIKYYFLGKGKVPPWVSASGKDYLEIQFGIMPYLSLFIGMLEMVNKTMDSLYGESFRRERWNKTPQLFETIESSLDSGTAHRGNSLFAGPLGPYNGSTFSYGPAFTETRSFVMDHRLTMRASRIGRPTSGLISIIDSLPDQVDSLGLWYPSMGWDLLPYSWFIDYFLHIGSAIERVSAYSVSGATPLDYAYCTTKITALSTRQYVDLTSRNRYGTEFNVNRPLLSAVTTTKDRRSVTPFGFSMTGLDGLSGSQYAILVALGLAKKP